MINKLVHSKIFSLTKVILKNSFQNMRGATVSSDKKRKSKGMLVFTVIAFLYLGAIFGFLSYGMITSLIEMHQEQIFLGILFLGIGFLLLFQSIFSSLNVFYFSKDMEHILPLPLKPWEIIVSKMNVLLVTEYITEIIFFAVPLVLYGILTGSGFLFYIMAILVMLIFPILPILIASFIIMLIMSFAKFTKNRDSFQVIASIIAILVVLVVSFTTNQGGQIEEEQMMALVLKANGLVDMIGNYFVTLKPAIHAMVASSIVVAMVELIKLIGITAIAYAVFLLFSQKLYLRGAVGNSTGGSKKTKKLTGERIYRKHATGISYVKKELKILIRNPIFLMQCVLPAVLMPILFGFIFISGMSGADPSEMQGMENIQLTGIGMNVIVVCIVLGIIQFFSMMIYVAATAISRDGLNATWMKYIPLSLTKQFIYKAIPNTLISMVTILIVIIAATLLLSIPFWEMIPVLIIAILFSLVQSFLMEMVDLRKPKLEWETEYAVVKQNMNLIWPMLLGLANIFILIVLGAVFASFPVILIEILLIALLTGILYGLYRYIKKREVALFKNIY